jgi:hypothetical protein
VFGGTGPLDDLDVNMSKNPMNGLSKDRALISAVGVEFQQEWVHAKQGGHHQNATIAILDIRRMHDCVEQQALGIYEDVALLTLDFLARIIPMRIDFGPPFSALLTLWLSIIATVGLASRPARSRHLTWST